MSPSKHCVVCGDKALGYNFNAVTCESCKAFFRRNALAKKQFTCPFNQNCEITVVTRRFCQKCRLKKCLDIGMKSENIMSEEDKVLKRRKIENNRAKRRMMEQKGIEKKNQKMTEIDIKNNANCDDEAECAEDACGAIADSSSSNMDMYATSNDSQSCSSVNSSVAGPSSSTNAMVIPTINVELMTSAEMVEFIVCDPDRASQAISKLMRTPDEAFTTMEKIINSQKDALRLISHLIAYPGDGLKIISKIMNSPFNALTVFTKFMSSPTDALEIISKIVSSPQDVVIFVKNLMQAPEDALDIMNKFMNTPAEALKMLNKIFNGANINLETPVLPQSAENTTLQGSQQSMRGRSETVIQTMLNNSPNSLENAMDEDIAMEHVSNTIVPELTTASLGNLQSPLSNSTMSSFLTPTASPASYVHASSPSSAIDLQYQHQSPSTSQNSDEQPSTSCNTLPFIINATDFNAHYMDQSPIAMGIDETDLGLNSLESVLSEVIRIEYQTYNSLQMTTRIKDEQQQQMHGMGNAGLNYVTGAISGGCNATMLQQQHQQQQQQLQNQQQPICTPSSHNAERDLNAAELMKLRELRSASEALYDPVDEDLSALMIGDERIKPEDTRQNPKLLQLINLTAVAIKRLIKMAKKISAFRDMCQEDQVALLKGSCTEMMIMRSVMNYDDDRNIWRVPHTKECNIRADLLKFAEGNVYEEHIKFISTFNEKWRMDENIILIMCAIVLFTPTRARVIHKDVIRLEQNSYYYLLRRYLESVYTGCEAKNAFIKLIQKISDVERLNKFIINVYLNVNPTQVEPLLREIFDLKSH